MEEPFIITVKNAATGDVTQETLSAEMVEARKARIRGMIVPNSITRRQCALQLLAMAMVSGAEAVEMVRSGIPPTSLMQFFNAMEEPARTVALIDFAADNYYRANPLFGQFMAANGMNAQQIDDFFIAATQL